MNNDDDDDVIYRGRNIFWPVKALVELASGPTACTCVGKSRAQEADDEELYYRVCDSLLASRLNISPVKKF